METLKARKKAGGRPVKAIKKEIRASVRFTKSEYSVIRQKADKAGINASRYMREIAINGIVKPRLNEEERQFVRQLVGMANNINQVAKTCHEQGVLKALLYFEKYRFQMDELLKKLQHGE